MTLFNFCTHPQQLELGFHSIRTQLLPRPISQLNSFLLDFDFYILVNGNSSTKEFKLCDLLKQSVVLSICYFYSVQFIDYFIC